MSFTDDDKVIAWRLHAIIWINVGWSSKMVCGIHIRAISWGVRMNLIYKMSKKIAILNLLPNLPVTNELSAFPNILMLSLVACHPNGTVVCCHLSLDIQTSSWYHLSSVSQASECCHLSLDIQTSSCYHLFMCIVITRHVFLLLTGTYPECS